MGRVFVLSALIVGLIAASSIAIVLAWQLKIETDRTRELTAQLADRSREVADRTKQENFALQQKCAELSEKYFKATRKNEAGDQAQIFDYQSHYNSKLNKCFTATNEVKFPFTTKMLFDVNEGRMFAYYFWMADKVKKYWEVPPKQCELTPNVQDKRNCSSEEEYEQFIAGYME